MGAEDRFGDRKKPPMVPMSSDQIWMFDTVRALNGRDRGTLVAWWLVSLMFLAAAIIGASVALYFISGVFLASAAWWTVSRVRAAREAAAIQRYADSRPETPE